MKKEYFSPEFELVKFKFEDIILTGSLIDDVPEVTKNDGDDFCFDKKDFCFYLRIFVGADFYISNFCGFI